MSVNNSSLLDTTSVSTTTKETAGGSSDTASTSYQECPKLTSEQEFFLYELEATDSGSIGLVLRAIYDCGDVSKFSKALEHRIGQYDKNIQKVCSHHYQGFIDSMKQLLQLREKCNAIKNETAKIDTSIQMTSDAISKKSVEVIKYRKQMRNAMVAIDQISVCLPVLDNYAKLQELMGQRKYYQALKVIEELEHTHLALIEKYRFTQDLSKGMQPLRKEIKAKAYSEFKDFLEIIKKVSARIGRHATKCTAQMHSFGVADPRAKRLQEQMAEANGDNVQITISADGSLVNTGPEKPKQKKRPSEVDDSDLLSAQDLIDFTPIHRCSQIFNVLGAKEEFETYYRTQRKEQCEMAVSAPAKLLTLNHYVEWMEGIIGFFVVEDHVSMTEPSLVTREHTETLWRRTSESLFAILDRQFGLFDEVEMMIRMKKVVLLFALTMKSYGYDITRMYQLLKHFTDQYTELLMREYESQFKRDLESDNYTPITVRSEEEWRETVRLFPFYKRSLEQEPFPRRLPYSKFVIEVYTLVKAYLGNCHSFMENLQISHNDIEDSMRKFANLLLIRWSEHLKQFIKDAKRTLVELVQLTINIGYVEKSSESLGTFISRIVNEENMPPASTGHLVALSEKVFRDARSEAEQQIEEALQKKIDVFLELASYDWELPNSSGHASDYITDLINFLQSTFLSFTNLPSNLARHVCMQICKYLADSLTETLLQSESRCISRGALDQFSLDVMQCEMFTARCPVAGLDSATLPVTFAKLRQILDLVIVDDWTTFLAEYRNDKRTYNRVKASDAIAILEKKVEFEKKSSGLFSGKGSDRRKLLETVLKQLRMHAAER